MYTNSFDTNSYTTTTTPKQDSLYPHSTLTPPFTLGSNVNITSPVINSTQNNVNIASPIIPPQLPPIQFNISLSHILPTYNTDNTLNNNNNHIAHSNNNTHSNDSNYKKDKQPPITMPSDDQLYTPAGSSAVWQIFKLYKQDSSWAYCCAAVPTSIHGTVRRCGKWFIYHHPTTTNLKTHIYMQHKAMHDELYPETTDAHNEHSTNNKTVERHRNGKIKRDIGVKKLKHEPITLSDVPNYEPKYNTLYSNHHTNNENANNLLLQSQLNNVQCTDMNTLDTQQAYNTLMHQSQFAIQMCNLLQRIMERTTPVVKQEINATNGQIQPHLIKLPYLDASAAATLKLKHIESCYNTRNIDTVLDCYSEHTLYQYNNHIYNNKVHLQQHIQQQLQNCSEDTKYDFHLFSASSNHITTHVTYNEKRIVMLLTFDDDGLISETHVYDTT